MRVSKVCNYSLLKTIAQKEELTYTELKNIYCEPTPRGVILGQHRTIGAAGFGGPFAPIVQYEKWKIHTVFPHFPYFRLGQNLPPNLLAPLCGVALGKNVAFDSDLELLASEGHIQITDDIIKFIRF